MSYEITSDPLALSVADGAATLDIAASRDGYFMAAVMVDGRETVGVRVPEAAMVTFARAVLARRTLGTGECVVLSEWDRTRIIVHPGGRFY